MTTKNLHVPMLDDKGDSYIFQENQIVRMSQFFFYMTMNPQFVLLSGLNTIGRLSNNPVVTEWKWCSR